MYCLNVSLNDQRVCSAGMAGATLITAIVGVSLFDDEPASFHVAGMADLENDRSAHVDWLDETPMKDGDTLAFTFVDQSFVSTPLNIRPLDSPEYIEEQRQFAEFREAHLWPHKKLVRRRGNVELNLSAPNCPAVRAGVRLGHLHILCSLSWDKWSPERTRVFVRSFGDDLQPLEWLRTNLSLDDVFRIDVNP